MCDLLLIHDSSRLKISLIISTHALAQNLKNIRCRIKEACQKADRESTSVRLLLATKGVCPKDISSAIQAGADLLGENYVQELLSKKVSLNEAPISWHFVGHLQANKVKAILGNVECIQTIDRSSLVTELDKHLQHSGFCQEVFVQVNTSGEETKHGVRPEETIPFVKWISKHKTLRIRGLMTIGPRTIEHAYVRRCFRGLRLLAKRIRDKRIDNVAMSELSMGMSNDYDVAIEEGATLVRIGRAVFGKRAS